MLIKDRTKSIRIKKLEVIQRRLVRHHPRFLSIEDELGGRLAGHYGEQSNDYFLKPFNSFSVLHDLRLSAHDSFFQIDTLLLSPRFLLILEVKYITGTLIFDHLNQVIRIRDDGTEEAFQNPIFQVKRQQSHLIEWMARNRIPQIPVRSLVVMSNPKTIIKAPPSNKEVSQYITHSPYLQERIKVFEKMFIEEKFTRKQIGKLSKILIHQHTPENPDLLKRYQIEEKDIIKGVYCTKCFFMPVHRKRGTWFCPKCSYKSNDLHLNTLMDFALLFGTKITNQQFCDFLCLSSRHVAKRLLFEMNLHHSGGFKGRIYILPEPE
ncbi:nuclease-related domain-containing protein [Fictibacillus barbaricus]|uniref:NERD domain-containing protein n=1 Tax=Fictibacillus barbaricus TaxID=182136 RepID=A0ABS2ZC20_9BACL|nr:nuclease-related domain-containing protein [Fictibacillus barbaricus]MBN3544280.1 NERD domain-containing protein [Fictibacillus barbaricus]